MTTVTIVSLPFRRIALEIQCAPYCITYALPGSLFASQADVQVFTTKKVQLELSNEGDVSQLDMTPDENNLEELMLVGIRRAMWIPNLYALLCHKVTSVDVWNRVYGNILQNGHSAVCSPLIQFLQHQLLRTHVSNTAIFTLQELVQPRATSEFLRHCSLVLAHLIPAATNAGDGTNNTGAGGNAGPFGMTPAQFQEFINTMRQEHTAPAPTTSTSTSVT